jgi:hypothetical protein
MKDKHRQDCVSSCLLLSTRVFNPYQLPCLFSASLPSFCYCCILVCHLQEITCGIPSICSLPPAAAHFPPRQPISLPHPTSSPLSPPYSFPPLLTSSHSSPIPSFRPLSLSLTSSLTVSYSPCSLSLSATSSAASASLGGASALAACKRRKKRLKKGNNIHNRKGLQTIRLLIIFAQSNIYMPLTANRL